MRKAIVTVLLTAALSSGKWADSVRDNGALTPCGGGGPDSFGYRYLDSDTVCPGAPTFDRVDIKGVGTRVAGLGDDNYDATGPRVLDLTPGVYFVRFGSGTGRPTSKLVLTR